MAKRSKKKAAARMPDKHEKIEIAKAAAEQMRSMHPEQYFAGKSKAFDDMMKLTVANDVVQKAYKQGHDAGGQLIADNIGTNFTAAMCLALHDLYGFGKKRICDLMDRMNEIMLETFTTPAAVQRVYKELGLRFSDEDPFHWLTFDD